MSLSICGILSPGQSVLEITGQGQLRNFGLPSMNRGVLVPRLAFGTWCEAVVGGSGLSLLGRGASPVSEWDRFVISFLVEFLFFYFMVDSVLQKCHSIIILVPNAFNDSFCLSDWCLYLLNGLLFRCFGCWLVNWMIGWLAGWLVA